MSDELATLVSAARSGDRQAYGCLVERHWDGAVRLARSLVGDGEAEDVAQDALIQAWQSLGQLSSVSSFKAWLMRIVYRRGLRRTRWYRLRVALGLRPELTYDCDPSADVDLARLLARLAPRQRAVLQLTIVEELTDVEIGEVLQISAGSVRAHRRRARASLRRILEEKPS